MANRFKLLRKPTAEETALLVRCGHADPNVAMAAQHEFAEALTLPLKQGVLKGDILANIYEGETFLPGQATEYPLDFLTPGTESEFIAYTVPYTGRIPNRHIQGDYLTVPTFRVANSIDWDIRYSENARWPVVGRAMNVLEAGFTLKANLDGWHTILAAAAGRNLVGWDDYATAGLFTKRLVQILENLMRRRAGGNGSSVGRGKLTDLFVSLECHGDVLSWDLTQVPEAIRTQIWTNWGNGGLSKIGPVLLHDLDELGEDQEFQTYYTSTLSGTMPSDKVEIVVGLDLENRDSFVNPVRKEIQLFEDMSGHRAGRAGMYGHREHGFGVLDNRRCILGAV